MDRGRALDVNVTSKRCWTPKLDRWKKFWLKKKIRLTDVAVWLKMKIESTSKPYVGLTSDSIIGQTLHFG